MKKHKPDTITQEDWNAVESPPLSNSFLSGMKPVTATHPDMPLRVRGPQKAPRKTPVSLRLDESVLSAFRATGRGWQSRINDALLEWIKLHNHA